MMSETLYSSCAQVLSLSQLSKDDVTSILDSETGFAPRLRQICRERLADLEENPAQNISAQEIEALRMESDTWSLLQVLMPLRKLSTNPHPSPRDLLKMNPYTPHAALAQAIMYSSPLLTELVVVREWLQDSATVHTSGPGVTTGYWRFTKHQIMQSLRTGRHAATLVSEMDPDALVREGKGLAADDASYEKALVQTLYAYMRAGQLDDAIELCRKAHQPWRAASIRGSLLFRWRGISNAADQWRDEDMMDVKRGPDAWRGNQRRQLWKTTCTKAALNPNLSDAERALYAALAPSPQTSTFLKAACRTWEDYLWAQLSIVCEEKQTAEMTRFQDGSFWEGGLEAVERGLAKEVANMDEEQEWEQEAIGALESLSNITVEDGPPADDPYHISQLYIILGRTDALLTKFADGLQAGTYDATLPEYPTMARFFAHLCLFLQLIDVPVPPLALQVILEAYLNVLEAAGQRDLIAMYAGALGDNAIERYAMFLTSLELSADLGERRLALTRARDHGLDMELVAVATAERTIEKAFSILPPTKGPLPPLIGLQPPPSDVEWLLVRSIEWTTFLEPTYDTALEQVNMILRYLLAHGRTQVAKILLDMLPAELASIRDPEERATEYFHYRQFFIVWETLERVVECQALETPDMNRDTRAVWLSDYKVLVQEAEEQVTKLLTTDWLVLDVVPGIRKHRDLIRIRQIYIPDLIIRLHATLFASHHRIPENLKRVLLLANIVADSRYKLYDDFVAQDGRRLGDYLSAVRQAVLGGLEMGGSDPFMAIIV